VIQLQVLNKILRDKDPSLIILNNLDESYFSDYRSEFLYIKNHLNTYGNICDLTTFLDVFPDFEVIQVNESDRYLIEALIEDKNRRYLAENFNKIRTLLLNDKTEDAVALLKNAADDISKAVAIQPVDIIKDTSRYDAYLERTQDFSKYYVTTGFKELDAIIGGWDKEEELATIIARSNQGKSWVIIKCAVAAAQQGLNVGIYSGEMSERKVGYRVDTLLGHIANGSLIHGNSAIQNEYKKYIDEIKDKVSGSIKVLTPQMINGAAGVTALRAFIEKEKLDILFIDQHSLLEDDRKAKTPVEKASNISKDLKLLQVLKRIPIVSVSQMNRTKSEEGSDLIDLSQIAQADRIGQDSTIVIGISRDKKDNNLMRLQLVKSRDSENGKILCYNVDLNKGIFTYIPDEKDTKSAEDYSTRYYEQPSGEDVF